MYEGKLLMVETPDGLRHKAYGGDMIGIRATEGIRFEHRRQLEGQPFTRGKVKTINDQEIEMIVDDASTAIPLLVEWSQAQRLTIEMIEQKSPPYDDVFVKLIEKERSDV
jgi:ABC-type multidrug transport system ATPase subunit